MPSEKRTVELYGSLKSTFTRTGLLEVILSQQMWSSKNYLALHLLKNYILQDTDGINVEFDRPIGGYESVEEGEYVVLAVSDTGKGISPEEMERIFEPFYFTSASRYMKLRRLDRR